MKPVFAVGRSTGGFNCVVIAGGWGCVLFRGPRAVGGISARLLIRLSLLACLSLALRFLFRLRVPWLPTGVLESEVRASAMDAFVEIG